MAIYHFHVKTLSKAKGQSARAKVDYILREGKYRERYADEVVYSTHEHMPRFAEKDPQAYWQSADVFERSNGRLCKSIEFALPCELSLDEQIALSREFAQALTHAEHLPYSLAIHRGKDTNPHCHLMVSERMNDGVHRGPSLWFHRANLDHPEQGGAKKTRALKRKEWLEAARQTWAERANRALERSGKSERIDHRTLLAQGITSRLPQVHIGPGTYGMAKKQQFNQRAHEVHAVLRGNEHLAQLHTLITKAHHDIQQLVQYTTAERTTLGLSVPSTTERDPRLALHPGMDGGVALPGSGTSDRINDAGRAHAHATPPTDRVDNPLPNAPHLDGATRRVADTRGAPTPHRDLGDLHTHYPERGAIDAAQPAHVPMEMGAAQPAPQPDARPPHTFFSNLERPYDLAGKQPKMDPVQPALSSADPHRTATGRQPLDSGREEIAQASPLPSPTLRTETQAAAPHPPVPSADLTTRAVERQLQRFGGHQFEIGIRERSSGKFMKRTWTDQDIFKAMGWLKRMNAQGNDIFIQPAPSEKGQSWVVVPLAALPKITPQGPEPALVVKTGPATFEAWYQLDRPFHPAVCREVTQLLRQPGVYPPHEPLSMGHLAGFSNQDPALRTERGYPFVQLVASSSHVLPFHEHGVVGQAFARAQQVKVEQDKRLAAILSQEKTPGYHHNPLLVYRVEMARLRRTYGDAIDVKRANAMALRHLVQEGFNDYQIQQALLHGSPLMVHGDRRDLSRHLDQTLRAAKQPSLAQTYGLLPREAQPEGWNPIDLDLTHDDNERQRERER